MILLCIHTAWWNRIHYPPKLQASEFTEQIERGQTFRQGRGVRGLHVHTVGSPSVLGTPGCSGAQRKQK